MEKWKTVIPGYYEVSDLGNVRSVDRYVDNGRGTKSSRIGQLLSPSFDEWLYLHVTFRVNNVKTTPSIHRMVATAFIEDPNNLPEVNHKDGVKTNNKACNLEWVTHSDNMKHAYSTGLASKVGVRNTAAVLTEAEVIYIRSKQGKQSGQSLGQEMRVGKSAIYKIWNRETWTHI